LAYKEALLLLENDMPLFKRTIATFTTVCVLGVSVPAFATSANSAQIISTEEIASAAQTQQIKDQVRSALDRAEVQQALQSYGVDAAQLRGRVDALTDAEAAQVAKHLNELPAGGDVIGVLFAVFIILLITDILGLTKVFPFTRSVR
jgi:hypothetical protein